MTRDPKVRLPAEEARCRPGNCAISSGCARALAELPPTGGTLTDYSATNLIIGFCHHWLDASKHKGAPVAEPRKVFPPLGTA